MGKSGRLEPLALGGGAGRRAERETYRNKQNRLD